MRIGMRLLLGYFLLVAVAAWFVLAIFVKEVKPGVRRATEGTLIDTATLLAELARPDLLSGDPTHGQLAQAFNQLQHRPFRANIGGINKVRNEYHVYMTDAQGKVLFDSANKAVGQDYSRWNDVWLTLRGQYGAQHVAKSCRARKFCDVCCRADYGRLAAYWRFERRQTERGDGSGH